MAIVNPGERLPVAYLEYFDPAENVNYRFTVLSTSAIAVEFHWVDMPSKNSKGKFQCLQGICCSAMGRRSQTYNIPIYVYRQAGSTEGDVYTWSMTPARWKKFSDLALQIPNLIEYDLTFSAQKRGQGMDWSYSVLPDARYRDHWSAEQREQLDIATKSFYQLGESSLCDPMSPADWVQLLYEVGYDVQNQCWPGGQSPMSSMASFGAIRGAVGAGSMLPPPPPVGYAPSQQGYPNVAGGIILQPPQLQGAPSNVIPHQASGLVPQQIPVNPIGSTNQPQTVPAVQPIPPTGIVPVVPLGTVPNVPSASTVPVNSVTTSQQAVTQGVGNVSPSQNTVQTQLQEITSEELNAMLS